jgi:hypothetical protein
MLLALSRDSASSSPETAAPVSLIARYENFGIFSSFWVQGSKVQGSKVQMTDVR